MDYSRTTDYSRTNWQLNLLFFAINTDYSWTTDTEFLLVRKSVNGPCFVTGQSVIDLIELGFNDTSTLVGHFVSLQRKGEER